MNQDPQSAHRLLCLAEVAALLAVSIPTVRRRIHSGDLRALRIGRLLRVRPQDLDAYLYRSIEDKTQ